MNIKSIKIKIKEIKKVLNILYHNIDQLNDDELISYLGKIENDINMIGSGGLKVNFERMYSKIDNPRESRKAIDTFRKLLDVFSRGLEIKVEDIRNDAQKALDDNKIETSSKKLIRIAKRCGYDIRVGGDGFVVRDLRKNKITEIPKSKVVASGTARSILKALSKGVFVGRKSA